MEEESEKNTIGEEIMSWIKPMAIALAAAYLLNAFVIVNAKVPTGSMESTILPNDRIVASRLSYLFNPPSRFDIVVFRYPEDLEVLYIKRVIGLPGETVVIINGNVYIDGVYLEEDSQFKKEQSWGSWGPFVLGEDEYFVLGDHRNNSEDSRAWTYTLRREHIIGRAVFKYFRGFEILN